MYITARSSGTALPITESEPSQLYVHNSKVEWHCIACLVSNLMAQVVGHFPNDLVVTGFDSCPNKAAPVCDGECVMVSM